MDGSARCQWVIVAPSRSGSSCRARFSRSDSSPPPCGAARAISRPTQDRPRGHSARARRSSEAHGFNHLIVLDASAAYKASGAPSTLPGGLPPPTAASSQRRRGQAHAEAPLPRVRVVRSRRWPAGCRTRWSCLGLHCRARGVWQQVWLTTCWWLRHTVCVHSLRRQLLIFHSHDRTTSRRWWLLSLLPVWARRYTRASAFACPQTLQTFGKLRATRGGQTRWHDPPPTRRSCLEPIVAVARLLASVHTTPGALRIPLRA